MLVKNSSSDLCINCKNTMNCYYKTNSTRPVIFCEEFSCADPEGLCSHRIGTIAEPPFAKAVSSPKEICGNCENADTCRLKIQGMPVTCCEEYK
ncbi:MAG: hypothetical protein ABR534_03855 [Desulfotignum sp.]|nr:hypothetical protein [Desulfobacteraceae bacterium]